MIDIWRALTGWVALIVILALALLAEVASRLPLARRVLWSLAALVAVHAALASWREG